MSQMITVPVAYPTAGRPTLLLRTEQSIPAHLTGTHWASVEHNQAAAIKCTTNRILFQSSQSIFRLGGMVSR